jgi:dienelactone hydrolase
MDHHRLWETEEVEVPVDQGTLPGFFNLPWRAKGLVLFAHGSSSSRFSHRNRVVAEVLNRAQLATLLLDLLTTQEQERDAHLQDLGSESTLLTERMIRAVDWVHSEKRTAGLGVGVFGANTGAAVALGAAAARPEQIQAVVSCSGRVDLAGEDLYKVRAPTLLIAGSLDPVVVETNRRVARQMPVKPQLHIISRASHLFQEAGKLDEAAWLARDWFVEHL